VQARPGIQEVFVFKFFLVKQLVDPLLDFRRIIDQFEELVIGFVKTQNFAAIYDRRFHPPIVVGKSNSSRIDLIRFFCPA